MCSLPDAMSQRIRIYSVRARVHARAALCEIEHADSF